jgi:hypothetical protein
MITSELFQLLDSEPPDRGWRPCVAYGDRPML